VDEITALDLLLREGLKASMQGNYERRMADPRARGALEKAREGLQAFVRSHPNDARAWVLLSQAYEALLQYDSALLAAKRAAIAGLRGKREMKRLARLEERCGFWKRIDLSPEQAAALSSFLEARVEPDSTDFSNTQEWLSQVRHPRPQNVIEGSRHFGCNGDFELYVNLLR
jgi:tetratricopeptide (TPR) repeat protein